jgi:dienelactone hydrolase
MVALIPRSVLFGNPERIQPRISPDGGSLAWIAPKDGVLNVWMAPILAPADPDSGVDGSGVDWAAARVMTADADRGIRTFSWARDGRHLLYVQDAGGDENWRLYDVAVDSLERRDLTPFDKIHGELVKEIENPGYAGWLADEDLVVRCAIAPLPDGSFDVLVREAGDADFRTLLTIPAEDATSTDVVSFSGDGRSVLMTSAADSDTARLTKVDLATGAATVLASDPEVDISGVLLHPDTRDPQIAMFLKDRMEYLVLDPSVAEDLRAVQKLHPGDPSFAGRDDADATWLIAYNIDAGSIAYYMYDRATRTGKPLFVSRPELADYTLAAMEPFSFAARDGLVIHGYLTFPPGINPSSLPAVLNVHGGPQVRDAWGYDPEAQWFGNRGYLCVQVNYRGSTGYGKAFVAAGDREWGGKMHDDLIDAVAYIVGQGWADPARVAIYGGSYGGYAALVGAAFTPDVFCCAVDIVGPSNLKTLLETIPPYWAPMIAQLYRRVGNPETDEEFLWSRSPLSRAADIRTPLLIAQGANDPRVKQAESEQIVAALKDAGIDYEYMLFPDEGHGFAKPENRIKFYAAAERFLARYLGGRFEE